MKFRPGVKYYKENINMNTRQSTSLYFLYLYLHFCQFRRNMNTKTFVIFPSLYVYLLQTDLAYESCQNYFYTDSILNIWSYLWYGLNSTFDLICFVRKSTCCYTKYCILVDMVQLSKKIQCPTIFWLAWNIWCIPLKKWSFRRKHHNAIIHQTISVIISLWGIKNDLPRDDGTPRRV